MICLETRQGTIRVDADRRLSQIVVTFPGVDPVRLDRVDARMLAMVIDGMTAGDRKLAVDNPTNP